MIDPWRSLGFASARSSALHGRARRGRFASGPPSRAPSSAVPRPKLLAIGLIEGEPLEVVDPLFTENQDTDSLIAKRRKALSVDDESFVVIAATMDTASKSAIADPRVATSVGTVCGRVAARKRANTMQLA